MPNLESSILPSDAPTVPMKSMLPGMDMMAATKGTKTTSTANSSHTMGLDKKSKEISKRGKKTFQEVSIVLIFISVISLFLLHNFG